MSEAYVTQVTSNIKSPTGDLWSIDLNQRTLLYGGNTSHKSAVINAVELAVSGAADDIVGRSEVRDAALLMTLTPSDKLSSVVTWDDGKTTSGYSIERGKTVGKPNHIIGEEAVLPLRSVREALRAGTAKARKAFLGWVSSDVTAEDVLAHIPTTAHTRYIDIAEKQSKNPVTALLAVSDYAAKQQRSCAKEAKGAEAIIESMSEQLPARPTDAEMTQLREAFADAERIYEDALRTSSQPVVDTDEVLGKLERLDRQILNDEARFKEALDVVHSDQSRMSALALTIIELAIENDLSTCPTCSSPVGYEHLETCRGFYVEQVATSQVLNKAHQDNADVLRVALRERQAEKATLEATLESANAQAPTSSVISEEDARARLYAAREALERTTNAVSRWGDMSNARDKAAAMNEDAASYKSLASACATAIVALLQQQSEAFAKRVQKFLPKNWVFKVVLQDGTRSVFRMGLLRGDKLHCALSGAEWATVTTAIAMATVGDKAAILIPEDRAWDSKTLKSVLQAFSNFDGQVILASTTKPAGRLPKGWDIVDMDAWLKDIEGTNGLAVAQEEPEEEEEQAPTLTLPPAPTKEKAQNTFSARSVRMLKGLGFTSDQLDTMSSGTAAELVKAGLIASQVTINQDGSWSARVSS